mmetsp:Transcript_1521/g.2738  ORF Transcript_1521/g.2738 Transcript_1521/m.2738 type:complete len:202 (+) Transcript_1521:262-867(+)
MPIEIELYIYSDVTIKNAVLTHSVDGLHFVLLLNQKQVMTRPRLIESWSLLRLKMHGTVGQRVKVISWKFCYINANQTTQQKNRKNIKKCTRVLLFIETMRRVPSKKRMHTMNCVIVILEIVLVSTSFRVFLLIFEMRFHRNVVRRPCRVEIVWMIHTLQSFCRNTNKKNQVLINKIIHCHSVKKSMNNQQKHKINHSVNS